MTPPTEPARRVSEKEVEAADDGIRCPVCRGSGYVVGEDDRIMCRRCSGTGAWREAAQRVREEQANGE